MIKYTHKNDMYVNYYAAAALFVVVVYCPLLLCRSHQCDSSSL